MKIKPIIEQPFSLKEAILKLHILYLEKCDSLSKDERKAYEVYFNHLANPEIFIKRDDLNISGDYQNE